MWPGDIHGLLLDTFQPSHQHKRYRSQSRAAMDVSAQSDSSKKLKYFIMKSNNSTNIDRSLASGVWSTQYHNEAKLNDAFLDGYEVRLIFSITQSGHFQG